MKKISLIVMSCIIACGLLANHGIVKGGEMSPKVEDTVSIAKKITDSQWLSNNSGTLEVDTAGEDSVVNVVAYFCKGDTCEYWIYENEWKVDGKDTVKTLGRALKKVPNFKLHSLFLNFNSCPRSISSFKSGILFWTGI